MPSTRCSAISSRSRSWRCTARRRRRLVELDETSSVTERAKLVGPSAATGPTPGPMAWTVVWPEASSAARCIWVRRSVVSRSSVVEVSTTSSWRIVCVSFSFASTFSIAATSPRS